MLKCPLCQSNTLWITNNDGLWGEWLYCLRCRRAGDILEWSSAVLKRPIEGCIDRFKQLNLLYSGMDFKQQLATYRSKWPVLRSTAQNFLQMARRQVEQPPGRNLDLLAKFIGVRWLEPELTQRISQHFGWIAMSQLRQPQQKPDRADTLIVPTYDLPGRIAGVMLFTLHPEDPPVLGYRSFDKMAGVEQFNMCAGLTMLPQALGVGKTDLFIHCDPVEAMYAYLRWLRNGADLAPIVIPVQQSLRMTRTVWNSLPPRNLIFSGNLASTLQFASKTSGSIKLTDTSPFKNFKTAAGQLQQLKDEARPWQQTIIDVLNESLPANRVDVFMNMDITATARELFINQAPIELRQQLTTPLIAGSFRTFRYDNVIIHESAEGWYTKNKRLVANGIIRVDYVIRAEGENIKSPGQIIRGRVLLQGRIYEYDLTLKTVNRLGLFEAIREYLLKHYGCMDFRYHPLRRWNKKGLELAITAYRPEAVKQLQSVGWDAKNQKFVFDEFVIERNGVVNKNWQTKIGNRSLQLATNIPRPLNEFPSDLMEPFERTDRNAQISWLMIASVLHELLAPYVGRPQNGIVVASYAFPKTQPPCMRALSLLGCGVVNFTKNSPALMLHRIELAANHNWPLNTQYCRIARTRDIFASGINKKIIFATSPPLAMTAPGSLIVPEPCDYQPCAAWGKVFNAILPYLLRFVLQQQIRPLVFNNKLETTFEIIRRWLVEINASTDGLDAAIKLNKTMRGDAFRFVACIIQKARAIQEKCEPPHTNVEKKLTVFNHQGLIFVSKAAFRAFQKKYLAALFDLKFNVADNFKTTLVDNPQDYYIFTAKRWATACKINGELATG